MRIAIFAFRTVFDRVRFIYSARINRTSFFETSISTARSRVMCDLLQDHGLKRRRSFSKLDLSCSGVGTLCSFVFLCSGIHRKLPGPALFLMMSVQSVPCS
jgi:hypothetical protein